MLNLNMERNMLLCLLLVISSGFVVSQVPDGVVWTSPIATFWLGQTNAKLTCETRGKPIAVYWMRGETASTAEILVSWYNKKSSGTGVDQGTHDINQVTRNVGNVEYNDFSLVFTEPTLEDTGRYICRVSNENAFLINNHTDLRVLDPVVNIVNTLPNKMEWKGQTVALPCDFSATAKRVIWNRQMQTGTGTSLQTVLTYADGIYNALGGDRYGWSENFALVIWRLEVTDEATYTCVVQVDSGDELKNSTDLTVNARAEDPFVQIKDCVGSADQDLCILEVSRSEYYVDIVCTVKGAKPTVNVVWIASTSGNDTLGGTTLDVRDHDGESDTTRTLRLQTNEITKGNNFTCVASGLAVNGTANHTVVIQIVKAPPRSSSGQAATVAVSVIVILLLLVIIVVVVLLRTGKWKPTFLRGFTAIGNDNEEQVPLTEISIKRNTIRDYKPETAGLNIEALNIGLFGAIGVGKSAFVNSLLFSYNGNFSTQTDETATTSQGSQTKFRERFAVTDHINVLDNKGMRDYEPNQASDLMAQIRGKRGQDSQSEIKNGLQIHVPVLVCNMRNAPENMSSIIANFVKAFSGEVNKYYGRDIMIVVTHKESLSARAQQIRDNLSIHTNISKDQIMLFENFTTDSHEEDEERSIAFLDFILACLEMGKRNVQFKHQQDTQVPETKSLVKRLIGPAAV